MPKLRPLQTFTKDFLVEVLRKNKYSRTETAHELGITGDELWMHIGNLGIRLTDEEIGPFVQDVQGDLKRAIAIAEDIIEMCSHCADFSNGNEAGGFDEGRVMASRYFYDVDQKLKLLKNRNNL